MKPESIEFLSKILSGDFDEDIDFIREGLSQRWFELNPVNEARFKYTNERQPEEVDMNKLYRIKDKVKPKYLANCKIKLEGFAEKGHKVDRSKVRFIIIDNPKAPINGHWRNGSSGTIPISLIEEAV